MGDWRMVRVVGTFDPEEGKRVHEGIQELSRYIPGESFESTRAREKTVGFSVNALRYGNDIFGWFWRWQEGSIDETNQLFERNFDPTDIERDLTAIATVAPSMRLAVHCGGQYLNAFCIATVHLEDGRVWIGAPEVPLVGIDLPEGLERVLLDPVRNWLGSRSRDELEDWEIDRLTRKPSSYTWTVSAYDARLGERDDEA